jgi:hypothetical protein
MYTTANATESPPNFVSMSLLRQMVNDPSTRAQLESNPAAAFAAHGIEINLPAEAQLPKMEAMMDLFGGDDGLSIPSRPQWAGLLS